MKMRSILVLDNSLECTTRKLTEAREKEQFIVPR